MRLMRLGNTVKVAGLRGRSGAPGLGQVQMEGALSAGCLARGTCMLTLSRRVVRWCMLKTPHGQKRPTDRCKTRTRESPHRAAPAEGRASSGCEGPEGDVGSDKADGDPDIAHIKLGPQPPADWQTDES